jgi:hypothetical protein
MVGISRGLLMARPSRPWFRESKNTWYCTLEGKKVSLKVRGRENEKEAIQAWHRLFANGTPEPVSEPRAEVKPEPGGVSVRMVIDAFLADSESRAKAKTLKVYRYFLLPFAQEHGEQLADAFTPTLAEAYSRKPSWKPQTRHGFLSTLVSAFRWAERAGMLRHHALRGIRKPPKMSRGMEALITPEEYAQLEDAATPAFRLLLKVL